MSYFQPSPLPSKDMWRQFRELAKQATFRVVDVEKITIPKDPTPEEEYFGMLYARHMTNSAKLLKQVQWNGKRKLFVNLHL